LEIIVPQVIEEAKKWGDIPIIAAGGIWDKTDIEKILSIGASAVQMGTRFVTTFESNASEAHKQALLNAKESDISLKPSPVGLPSRSINSNLHILIKEKLAPEIKCISNCVAPCKQGVGAREVGYCIADRLGDRTVETGLFFTGTNGYRCNEILSVHDLMKKLTEGEKSV
jgi:nitronate monooxygenase